MSSLVPAVPAGGRPDNTDLIVSAVFIAMFLFAGIFFHFRTFHGFGRRFIWSILCFGFCMARCAALALRIATTQYPTSINLAIVANVFLAAGTILLYIVNLQMARRLFGQLHPYHARLVGLFVNGVAFLLLPLLVMVIVSLVLSVTTTSLSVLDSVRIVRLVASCVLAVIVFLPIPIIILALALPRKPVDTRPTPSEKAQTKDSDEVEGQSSTDSFRHPGEPATGFGPTPTTKGGIWANASFILLSTALLAFEQGLRTAQAFYVPVITPGGIEIPWYMSKPAFWVCIFALEWIAIVVLGLAHLPVRFSYLVKA